MTKPNFIVSIYPKTWIKRGKQLFIAEPYVHHVLEKNDELKNYESVEVAPFIRTTREELIADNNFVDQKYHKYIPILAERLNRIHGANHDEFFWKKCMALGLIRYITLFYDVFKVCEHNFSAEEYGCMTLSKESYFIPKDFNEQRDFLQSTAFGQEQMFSIYINLFYPEKFNLVDDQFGWPTLPEVKAENKLASIFKRIMRITPIKLFNKVRNKWHELRQPRVGILESFFSASNLQDVINESGGLIRPLSIKSNFNYSSKPLWNKRKEIASVDADFDRFDKFFFTSVEHCFPKIFIEDFNQVYSSYINYFKPFDKLKYVVNESWIGNNYSSIAMAVLQQKGIKHIYNEHNFLSHHFLANNHKYIFPLVDEFVSLGWYKHSIPNLVKGGSLFEWTIKGEYSKEHDIAFITGIPPIKSPEISSSYGDFGAFNAKSHLDFNKIFFDNLGMATLNSILYRGYPIDMHAIAQLETPMIRYDQDYVLKNYLKNVKSIDYTSQRAKVLMQKSRLIVVDYLSTSYIESMMANIPTVFFWNKDIYYLEDEYLEFYDSLVSVGICQVNPYDAAIFIEKIKDNPEEWWLQQSVQDVKNKFLSNNFGHADILKSHLQELKG